MSSGVYKTVFHLKFKRFFSKIQSHQPGKANRLSIKCSGYILCIFECLSETNKCIFDLTFPKQFSSIFTQNISLPG